MDLRAGCRLVSRLLASLWCYGSYVHAQLLTLLCLLWVAVVAYFVAALSPNMSVANAALPTYTTTLLFFAGFFIRFENTPAYWIW